MLVTAALAVCGLFRVGFAVRFWRRVQVAGYFYVGAIIFLALIQLIFHVRL
jgi:hypothetical protein